MNAQLEAMETSTTNQASAQSIIAHTSRMGRSNWQTKALAANVFARNMRRQLAKRVFALTGRVLQERAIVENVAAQRVSALVDGVLFRLRGNELVIVRPCAYCGTGHFESAAIASRADLGYKLVTWKPFHDECAPSDPSDDVSW